MAEEFLIDIDIKKTFTAQEIIFRARLPRSSSWTILFGPSGAGKSTVLRCIAGLEKPEQGRIRFNGEIWNDQGIFVPPQHRRIGYAFQDATLFPHFSVSKNIGYHLTELSPREKSDRIAEMISLFRLEGLENRNVLTLSGGEKQRVALARTLIRWPRLLLLDEPLSSLDAPTRFQLRKELRDLLTRFEIPIIMVTHDRTEALSLGDHLIVMDNGNVLQSGPIHEVFSRPGEKRTAEIVGMENIFPGVLQEKNNGLAHIKIQDLPLTAVATDVEEGNIMVGIRAEDILISRETKSKTSARNRLPGKIRNIVLEESLVRVTIDCGVLIDALITRESHAEMNLENGQEIELSVKATAIHLFQHN
ncbi:MAG: ABC transporter ATP-binding protein [Nitrospinota bacterium]|nr:ABC transporter ATP-binding protein [Nitrospinota bacterium]